MNFQRDPDGAIIITFDNVEIHADEVVYGYGGKGMRLMRMVNPRAMRGLYEDRTSSTPFYADGEVVSINENEADDLVKFLTTESIGGRQAGPEPLQFVALGFGEVAVNGCKIAAKRIEYRPARDGSAVLVFKDKQLSMEFVILAEVSAKIEITSPSHKMWNNVEISLNPSEVRQYEESLRPSYVTLTGDEFTDFDQLNPNRKRDDR